MKIRISKNDYQAESDAYTLAEYEQIMSDSKRKAAAMKAARKQADDLTRRANMMNKACKKK